jgi:hypothetical protein
VPQAATVSDWSHFPITGLSLAASLLIIEVRKGVPSLQLGGGGCHSLHSF